MRKIRIGIDVDNVIIDFSQKFVDEFNKQTGKNLKRSQINKWSLKDIVDELYPNEINGELADKIIRSEVIMHNVSFKNLAKETLLEMDKNSNIDIVIITALHKELIPLRREWLKKELNDISYELYFESNKSNAHFHKPIDYLIDDGIHNLDELSKYIPEENCICIEEPYNTGSKYVTVKTLKEAYEYILKKENL